ncbi:hypothetical protein PF010_g19085 [Phytophthora fragariae]|uniref:Uncharacterized protein n=1 Tax=Phytophthora fragariae TaxID=53985 RepID=A0A6G0KJ43_9STRA|nr:hypothetical protein PF010_g19085 [Phytophthora fragariae]KAE9198517.1 hypothetical protein PF004_g19520 [Phytophthora fragariae]
MVRVAVLNIEGRREKLPARAALGTWVPTEDTMKILEMNGELERTRVAKWVSTLRKEDAAPLTNEASLQIGDMDPRDKELFIALLRQYAEIIEKGGMSSVGESERAAPHQYGRRCAHHVA